MAVSLFHVLAQVGFEAVRARAQATLEKRIFAALVAPVSDQIFAMLVAALAVRTLVSVHRRQPGGIGRPAMRLLGLLLLQLERRAPPAMLLLPLLAGGRCKRIGLERISGQQRQNRLQKPMS